MFILALIGLFNIFLLLMSFLHNELALKKAISKSRIAVYIFNVIIGPHVYSLYSKREIIVT